MPPLHRPILADFGQPDNTRQKYVSGRVCLVCRVVFVLFILLKIGFVLVIFGKLTKSWSFLAGRVDNALHFHFKYVSGRVCLVCHVVFVLFRPPFFNVLDNGTFLPKSGEEEGKKKKKNELKKWRGGKKKKVEFKKWRGGGKKKKKKKGRSHTFYF